LDHPIEEDDDECGVRDAQQTIAAVVLRHALKVATFCASITCRRALPLADLLKIIAGPATVQTESVTPALKLRRI
jgi:hypothetical protein